MNEYISHAVDGILYDPENPQALEELLIPESVAVLGAAAQDRALVARVAWEGQESAIVSFIGEEPAVWLIKRRLRGFYFRARALLLELGRRVKHWKE